MITEVTGILLAGGKSRRMGEDKRFVEIGRRSLLERSLDILRSVFQDVVIVIAQDSPDLSSAVPVVRDLVADCGSLGGLYTGLTHARTSRVFVVACDMPFFSQETVRYFLDLRSEADIVMARLHNGWHPMHALYGRRCLPVMESMMTTKDLRIHRLVEHPMLRSHTVTAEDLKTVDPEGRAFLNINTPADLELARSIFANNRSRNDTFQP
ncbi:MAG TPA: molybdenum cofactor guanylyltransferase [Nitrospira sp.]|nr:molybdenum cofactor guanylyltransferase [Nitrospira sp.]